MYTRMPMGTTAKQYKYFKKSLSASIFTCGGADRSGRGTRCCWGETIFNFPMYSFLGCEKEKLCLKRGGKRQKLCLKRGDKRQKLCIKWGVKRQKLCLSLCIDSSNLLYSTPQISERIPFLLRTDSSCISCLLSRFAENPSLVAQQEKD